MGKMTAMAIAETELSLEDQLAWHLRGNFYPPVPIEMVQPCIDAIDAAWEEDWDKEIALPENTYYKGQPTAPAWAIVEQHRLDTWLAEED
jgi:hypothetical protein